MQQLQAQSTLAQSDSSRAAVWRPGPHMDLLSTFTHWDPTSELGDCLQETMLGDSAVERINGAKQTLEKTQGTNGLAWLVLSREDAPSYDTALKFARTAVDCLKTEMDQNQNSGTVARKDFLLALAQVDIAQLFWKHGKKAEAIDLLCRQLNDMREFYKNSRDIVRDLTVSFLIQSGQDAEARQILHFDPRQDEAPWHYLNALLHYRKTGDSLISRSALVNAMGQNVEIAEQLLSDGRPLDLLRPYDYFLARHTADTRTAWLVTPGAQDFLKRMLHDPFGRFTDNLDILPATEQQKWKRWNNQYEKAHHYVKRQNYKEAKKALRSSLREAQQIFCTHVPFDKSIGCLLDHEEPTGEFLVSLSTILAERAAILQTRSTGLGPMDALQFQSLGARYVDLEKHEEALEFHSKALALIESHIERGNPSLTLFDQTHSTISAAASMWQLGRRNEAISFLADRVELWESYLGPNHDAVFMILKILFAWAHDAGEFERARSLHERLIGIEQAVKEQSG
jgi:tetratricopeptide (TPR) repeat protein